MELVATDKDFSSIGVVSGKTAGAVVTILFVAHSFHTCIPYSVVALMFSGMAVARSCTSASSVTG